MLLNNRESYFLICMSIYRCISFITYIGYLKRQSHHRASCTYFIQNFASNSMVTIFLHKNLRFRNGGHFKMNPPYNFFPALYFFLAAFHILFLQHSIIFSQHSILFLQHSIFFLQHSILFLQHSIFFVQHSILFLQHSIFLSSTLFYLCSTN